jgi:predicted dehydrogenase
MTDRTAAGYFRTLAIALHFRCGAVGTLLGSYDTSYAYSGTHTVEIAGTAGRLLIEDTVRRYSFSRHDSEVSEVWQAGYFNDVDRGFYTTFDKHFDALLAAFKAGRPAPAPARAGRGDPALTALWRESYGTRFSSSFPHASPGRCGS